MTLLLGGFLSVIAFFCAAVIAILLGQNAVYNGMESIAISTITFICGYLFVRYFARDKGKFFDYFKDEIFMAITMYLGLLLAGTVAILFFGEPNPSQILKSITFWGSCLMSFVVAVFVAYFWEVEEYPATRGK